MEKYLLFAKTNSQRFAYIFICPIATIRMHFVSKICHQFQNHQRKLLFKHDNYLNKLFGFICNPAAARQARASYSILSTYMVKHKSNLSSPTGATKSIKSISSLKSFSSTTRMKVLPIKALQDNYMYLLVDEPTRLAAAIDPVNASAVASAVHDYGVELKYILTTHHHYDHAHGNSDLLSMFPEISVLGGDQRVQAITRLVAHGETLKLGTLNIECISTPCHTKGHICYYITCDLDSVEKSGSAGNSGAGTGAGAGAGAGASSGTGTGSGAGPNITERAVFTGDTLFIAGCGRFFEGNSEQMDQNLNVLLGGLPSDTKVYCGHEYTVANLKFALTVEPQNMDIKNKLNWALSKMAKREPTVPSTIGEEKKINPFMRIRKTQVRRFTNETDDFEVMTELRRRKNEFQA